MAATTTTKPAHLFTVTVLGKCRQARSLRAAERILGEMFNESPVDSRGGIREGGRWVMQARSELLGWHVIPEVL